MPFRRSLHRVTVPPARNEAVLADADSGDGLALFALFAGSLCLLLASLGDSRAEGTGTFFAQPYMAVRGGGSFLSNMPLDYKDDTRQDRTLKIGNGWAVMGAVGVRPQEWLRTEFEIGYRDHAVKGLSDSPVYGGSAKVATAMLNAAFEWPRQGMITPYVGAGLGAAYVSHDGIPVDGAGASDTHAWAAAYQLSAGLAANISPKWRATAEYRFLGTTDPLFKDGADSWYNSSVRAQTILVGVSRSLY